MDTNFDFFLTLPSLNRLELNHIDQNFGTGQLLTHLQYLIGKKFGLVLIELVIAIPLSF